MRLAGSSLIAFFATSGLNSGFGLRDRERRRPVWRQRIVRSRFGPQWGAVLDYASVFLIRAAIEIGIIVVAVGRIVVRIVAIIVPAVIRVAPAVIGVVGIRRPRSIPEWVVPPGIPAECPIATPPRPSQPKAPASPAPTTAPSPARPTTSPTSATPAKTGRCDRSPADETGCDFRRAKRAPSALWITAATSRQTRVRQASGIASPAQTRGTTGAAERMPLAIVDRRTKIRRTTSARPKTAARFRSAERTASRSTKTNS